MFFVVAATLTWGGAILPVSLGDCRTLYKMMPVEDLRLQVIRSLRRPAAELQQAAQPVAASALWNRRRTSRDEPAAAPYMVITTVFSVGGGFLPTFV